MSDQVSVDDQKVIEGANAPKQSAKDAEKNEAVKDFSQVEENGQLSMRVRVHSPFKEYYDGQAFSVSAENATGPFDILPHHHSFISLLMPCEVVVRSVKEADRRIRISGGIMHVKADQIVIFLDV
jgi:hypothetical protein